MNRQPKLLLILGAIALVVIVGFFWMGTGQHTSTPVTSTRTHAPFDVASGDTNNEVLNRIMAQQKALQSKNAQQAALIAKLQRTNSAASRTALENAKASLERQISALKASLADQVSALRHKVNAHVARTPSSQLEYPTDQQGHSNSTHMITQVPDLSAGQPATGSTATPPAATPNAETPPSLPSDHNTDVSTQPSTPVYTIPDGSTVANVALLSPLIGEVPVNGSLQVPAFPFKAILSTHQTEQMFAANGIPLPTGLAGTILQGYSVGSMSLGCTRPYVTKLLFVFKDGHFVVFPKKGVHSNATEVYPKNALGYLSDAYNNPCINGKYLTDAPKVIASFMALGAAQGAGGAIAQAQTQTLTNIAQGTAGTIFNGNLGKYAAGLAVNEGAKDATSWYKARVNNIFDAVFVPSTVKGRARRLIFNVTQTIPIDFNQQGRVLHHERFRDVSSADHSLL